MKSKPDWHEYAGPEGFWGYGSEWKDADIIFIGPEFGGSQVKERVRFWEKTGKKQFVGLSDFMQVIDKKNKFTTHGTLSGNFGISSFGILLAMLMGKGTKLRKDYAQHCFGRSNLITKISWSDLSALPCPSTSPAKFNEIYKKNKTTRSQYESEYLPDRANRIREFFDAAKNKKVVLYGSTAPWSFIFSGKHQRKWCQKKFKGNSYTTFDYGSNKIIMVTHPAYYKVSESYFEECGRSFDVFDPKKYEAEVAAKIASD